MKSKKNLVKADYRGKKFEKRVHDACEKGELTAYVKHPETGEPIPVHPDLFKRLKNGETLHMSDILRYQLN